MESEHTLDKSDIKKLMLESRQLANTLKDDEKKLCEITWVVQ